MSNVQTGTVESITKTSIVVMVGTEAITLKGPAAEYAAKSATLGKTVYFDTNEGVATMVSFTAPKKAAAATSTGTTTQTRGSSPAGRTSLKSDVRGAPASW